MKSIIESQHLRVYVILARLLNMSRAADELRLTPSAISHALKALEKDLGCRLFERSSRKMTLSDAGQEFLLEAESILEQMKTLRARMQDRSTAAAGQLRIGASMTACQLILPTALREFRKSYPDYTVQIDACGSEQAWRLLPENRLDFVVAIEPLRPHPALDFKFLAEDELQFILHPAHPWAVRKKVPLDEAVDRQLILPEHNGETYALIEAYFRNENCSLSPLVEIGMEEAIKNFIHLDIGIGMLPRWMVAGELDLGKLIALPLGRRRLVRRWGILRSRGRELSLAENHFISVCREVMLQLMGVPESVESF
jgi:DNA-binding transcriptional LysR family regulator